MKKHASFPFSSLFVAPLLTVTLPTFCAIQPRVTVRRLRLREIIIFIIVAQTLLTHLPPSLKSRWLAASCLTMRAEGERKGAVDSLELESTASSCQGRRKLASEAR